MTEIWVPYGPVEVSFDIKQENLSQILEPQVEKITLDDLERRIDLVSENTVLLLSGTTGTQRVIDLLLTRNKEIRKILHPKNLGALARRKAQEFGVEAEQLNTESLEDLGSIDGSPALIPTQIKATSKLLLLTSSHYDPLFGLTSSASDVCSLVSNLKEQAFKRSSDELPCRPGRSNASSYSMLVMQSCSGVKCMDIVEKSNTGLISVSYGDPESVHNESVEFWQRSLLLKPEVRTERILFGCGGNEDDKSLTDALKSFFPVSSNSTLLDSGSRICMLAECSRGLGSEALLRYVTGKFEPRSTLDTAKYLDGLEVLLSFFKVQREYEMSILTTLPKFYASKFEFKTISGAREAPSSLVQSGSRGKILVVPDASRSYFSAT